MIYFKQIKEFKECKHGFKYKDLDLFDKWAEGKGITHFSKITNNDQLTKNEMIKLFPAIESLLKIRLHLYIWDHMVLFKNKNTGEMWFTSQPYSDYKYLMKFKDDHAEIDVQIYDAAHSWYYPGVTYLVVIKNYTKVLPRYY